LQRKKQEEAKARSRTVSCSLVRNDFARPSSCCFRAHASRVGPLAGPVPPLPEDQDGAVLTVALDDRVPEVIACIYRCGSKYLGPRRGPLNAQQRMIWHAVASRGSLPSADRASDAALTQINDREGC
jgi:hypothetical protein